MCRKFKGAAQRGDMDFETNQWGICLDFSSFHPDTLFPQQSAQMEGQGQREWQDICLHCTTQCHSYTSAWMPGKSLSLWTHIHTHTRTQTRTPLCPWHFAVWQQQRRQARLSSTVSVNTRQGAHNSCWVTWAPSDTCHRKNDKCTAKKLLSRGRLCWLTSCTATAQANVGILTILCYSSKFNSDQMSRRI